MTSIQIDVDRARDLIVEFLRVSVQQVAMAAMARRHDATGGD
jgi:hypothetical protein